MIQRPPLVSAAALLVALSACGNGAAGDGSDGKAATAPSCSLTMSPDNGATALLSPGCTRDVATLAGALVANSDVVKAARSIALGRTTLDAAGPFDRCAVMARLADDPRWTEKIDSNGATAPLRDALNAQRVKPRVDAALAGTGRKAIGVSVEMVLLSDGAAKDCPKSPARAPTEAQVWLSLE